jgi:hypothetical protein
VDSSRSQIDQTWAKKCDFDSNLGRILTADGDFLTIEAVQTCTEEACNNLGDYLASNLGVRCPLARVTGWAKKVGSIKCFREKLMSILHA